MSGAVANHGYPSRGTSEVWEDVVVAIHAVYQYPLERLAPIIGAMRARALFQPQKLASASIQELTEELKAAGYDRGDLTWQYADRLISFGKYIIEQDAERVRCALARGDVSVAQEVLLPIYGIGPKVIQNFVELRRRRAGAGVSGSDG